MNIYKCNKCGKIVKRDSNKMWIPSFCEELGIKTRLYKKMTDLDSYLLAVLLLLIFIGGGGLGQKFLVSLMYSN